MINLEHLQPDFKIMEWILKKYYYHKYLYTQAYKLLHMDCVNPTYHVWGPYVRCQRLYINVGASSSGLVGIERKSSVDTDSDWLSEASGKRLLAKLARQK